MQTNFYRSVILFFVAAGAMGIAAATSSAAWQDSNDAPDQGSTDSTDSTVLTNSMAYVVPDGGQPLMILSTGTSSNGGSIVFETAQPMLGFSPMGRGSVDPLGLVNDPDIQKEIEMVGDQLTVLKDMQDSFQQRMNEKTKGLREGRVGSAEIKELSKQLTTMRDELQAKMKDVLLPHQLDRLQQIATQQEMSQAGTADSLISDRLAETLQISDQQKERLKERSQQIAVELQAKIEALKEQAEQDLLQELNPDQRKKLADLIGNKYQFKRPDYSTLLEKKRSKTPAQDKK